MLNFEKQLKEICEENNLPFDVIERNLWKLSDIYDKSCHIEDIKTELAGYDYDVDKIPDEMLEHMLDTYEEWLADYGSECGYNSIIREVIGWYEKDLKEYELENIYNNMPDYEDTIDFIPHKDGARF